MTKRKQPTQKITVTLSHFSQARRHHPGDITKTCAMAIALQQHFSDERAVSGRQYGRAGGGKTWKYDDAGYNVTMAFDEWRQALYHGDPLIPLPVTVILTQVERREED